MSPAAWRAALKAKPTDAYTKLGLAQALIVRAFEVDADEEDEADELSVLTECAQTLASIKKLDTLSNSDALLYGSTTARCAARLEELGRPRLALAILTPAIALLDERAGEAGCAPGDLMEDAPSTAVAKPATAYAERPEFVPLNPEDTAPGELFDRTWPLPAVSWYYMRATLSGVAGAACLAVKDLERAIDELSHAALIAMVGTPLDYTRTADASKIAGSQLMEILEP